MKKVLVSILVIALLATASLTAFALNSPFAVGENKVVAETYASGALETLGAENYTINDDGTITFTKSESSEYDFEGWKITGEYELVSGSLTGDTITIRPLGDIRVVEMYDCEAAGAEDDSPTSPDTGSNLMPVGILALLSLSVAIVAKKRFVA